MIISRIQAKSVLVKSGLGNSKYSINSYTGCEHNCFYCYAHYMDRYTKHQNEWGSFIDIKENAPELLRKYFMKNNLDGNITIGTVTDPYQPIEKKEQITRAILEVLLEQEQQLSLFEIPYKITIITKGNLILRDIDLLKKFKNIEVNISITNTDSTISRKIEPFASSPIERIGVLKKLKANNIKCGAIIAPYLPFITDYQEIYENIINYIDFALSQAINTNGNIDKILYFYNKEFDMPLSKISKILGNKAYNENIKREFFSTFKNVEAIYF